MPFYDIMECTTGPLNAGACKLGARTLGTSRAGPAAAQVSTGRSGAEPSHPSAPLFTIAKKSRRPWLSAWISMS
jgi:hypothetical protein